MSGIAGVLLHDAAGGDAVQLDELFGCLDRVRCARRDAVVHEFVRRTSAVTTTAADHGTRSTSGDAEETVSLPVGADVHAHQTRSRGNADDGDPATPATLSPAAKTFLAGLARLAVKARLAAQYPTSNDNTARSTPEEDAT